MSRKRDGYNPCSIGVDATPSFPSKRCHTIRDQKRLATIRAHETLGTIRDAKSLAQYENAWHDSSSKLAGVKWVLKMPGTNRASKLARSKQDRNI